MVRVKYSSAIGMSSLHWGTLPLGLGTISSASYLYRKDFADYYVVSATVNSAIRLAHGCDREEPKEGRESPRCILYWGEEYNGVIKTTYIKKYNRNVHFMSCNQ